MIIRKSREELDKMRRSGRILAQTIDRVLERVAPGVSTEALDGIAEDAIRAEDAVPSFLGYKGFTKSICASINDEIVHGIPSPTRTLHEGDLLSLDFGAIWEGFHADSAVTVFVGGQAPSEDAARLVKTTEACLDAAIGVIQPGGRLSDIGHAIESLAQEAGWGSCVSTGGTGSAAPCTRIRSSRTGALPAEGRICARAWCWRWSPCSPSGGTRPASWRTDGPS